MPRSGCTDVILRYDRGQGEKEAALGAAQLSAAPCLLNNAVLTWL